MQDAFVAFRSNRFRSFGLCLVFLRAVAVTTLLPDRPRAHAGSTCVPVASRRMVRRRPP
jgi:hypothetical protein